MTTRDNHRLGETPLTDPRSLGSSILFHVALAALAAFTVMNVVGSPSASQPTTIRGELGPVDNRADQRVPSGSGGGGGPGEIGGLGDPLDAVRPSDSPGVKAERDPAADALLSEILPKSDVRPDQPLSDLPELPTLGAGLVPGSGSGGGGGRGGGSGGGVGRGVGPGTEFFGSREHGRSFAYVIDCSGSMGLRNALDVAKREMLASIDRLPPDVHFSVTFYHLQAKKLLDVDGRRGMMLATAANKARIRAQIAAIPPYGGTDHILALRTAFTDKPEVIFFLTDADFMSNNDVETLLREVGSSRIQAIEFGRGRDLGQDTPLRRLATTTGGSYHYIDITTFPKNAAGY